MEPVRVLIVNNKNQDTTVIKSLIQENNSIILVNEIQNLDNSFINIDPLQVDIALVNCLMDFDKMSDITKMLKHQFPGLKIISINRFNNMASVIKMYKANVNGIVLLERLVNELIYAVLRVAKGENYFSSEITVELLRPDKLKN